MDVYGREAAVAQGKSGLSRLMHRRDDKGRLKALEGLRLGDLRVLLRESALGQIERTLVLAFQILACAQQRETPGLQVQTRPCPARPVKGEPRVDVSAA